MSAPWPETALRESSDRCASLAADVHLAECIDLLQNPALFESEVAAALRIMSAAPQWDETSAPAEPAFEQRSDFYPARDIFVVRDSSSFTCLDQNVSVHPSSTALRPPIDYTAITCTSDPSPILGIVQPDDSTTAYPLLLRALSALCDLAAPHQRDRLSKGALRGIADARQPLDLHLVLWDAWLGEDESPERTPISQLTHDLAERAKGAVLGEPGGDQLLRDIVCLHMNPKRFDGRVRFAWRV